MSAPEPTSSGRLCGTTELLRAVALRKRYRIRRGIFGRDRGSVVALDGVSLEVARGETLGLVGESGSGKTTTGRLLLRLEEPDGGRVFFEGDDWLALRGAALRRRRRDMQIVFQDPQTSLNPRMTVGDQVAEPLRVQRLVPRGEIPDSVRGLFAEVGLPAAALPRFPSEFSGGERQRIAIARALATRPRFLVCDEPVSALDVSVSAQILNLFAELRERNGLSYLFISHDLAVVSWLADRIAVMYLGRIVEEGRAADVVSRPLHPYTAVLVSAAPEPDPLSRRRRIALPGEPASAADPPSGCAFHPRCPIARPRCREESPPLEPVESGRLAACFYPGELTLPTA